MNPIQEVSKHWRLVLFLFVSIGILIAFHDATAVIWSRWGEDRYSHAPIVLILAIYLIWIKRHELTAPCRDWAMRRPALRRRGAACQSCRAR